MKTFLTLIIPLLLCSATWIEPVTPTEHGEPEWVMEIMDKKPKFTKITRCVYGDEYVWKVNSCVTCNDMITKIYDANKNLVCQYGGVLRQNTCNEQDIFLEECRIIYKPKGIIGL